MAVTMEMVEEIRQHVGTSTPPVRATMDPILVCRYARAIGENNPIYFDVEAARSQGYDDVVVPPNFLPSYLDWTDGGPLEGLRPDGTLQDEMDFLPTEGVRIMGGGEEMVFHSPCLVGTEVVFTSHFEQISARESSSGLMFVLKLREEYTTADGDLLMTSTRTVLGR